MVNLLLDNGAEVNIEAGLYGDALQVSSNWNHKRVVESILEKRTSFAPGILSNAMQAAIYWAHAEVVKLLLEKRPESSQDTEQIGSALKMALRRGNNAIMKQPFDSCKEPSAIEVALQTAAYFGNDTLTSPFLHGQRCPDFPDEAKPKLLRAAVEGGNLEVFEGFRILGWTWAGIDSDGWNLEGIWKQSKTSWRRELLAACFLRPQEAQADPLAPDSWITAATIQGLTSKTVEYSLTKVCCCSLRC